MNRASRLSLKDRFWSKVDIRAKKECWDWKGCLHSAGYGQISAGTNGRHWRKEFSHRVAWLLANGRLPSKKHVLHRCDNRVCCNPSHLFLGTNLDNIKDKMQKGRQCRGEKINVAKLTVAKVVSIRKSRLSAERLAEKHGVSAWTIRDVIDRNTWRHVA